MPRRGHVRTRHCPVNRLTGYKIEFVRACAIPRVKKCFGRAGGIGPHQAAGGGTRWRSHLLAFAAAKSPSGTGSEGKETDIVETGGWNLAPCPGRSPDLGSTGP